MCWVSPFVKVDYNKPTKYLLCIYYMYVFASCIMLLSCCCWRKECLETILFFLFDSVGLLKLQSDWSRVLSHTVYPK